MKTKKEIGMEYGKTWSTNDVKYVDLGETATEKDFEKFLIEVAKKKEIELILSYKDEAKENLLEEYDKENITQEMVIAKTWILEMKIEKLWNAYEEEIQKQL